MDAVEAETVRSFVMGGLMASVSMQMTTFAKDALRQPTEVWTEPVGYPNTSGKAPDKVLIKCASGLTFEVSVREVARP